MVLVLYFQDFELSFQGSHHMDNHSPFEAYKRPPIVLHVRECSVLVDSSTSPSCIQGLKRLVLWTQNLALLEDQGLWIQTFVLHLSYAKDASQACSTFLSICLAKISSLLGSMNQGSNDGR